jgi:hypothetical protein
MSSSMRNVTSAYLCQASSFAKLAAVSDDEAGKPGSLSHAVRSSYAATRINGQALAEHVPGT